MKNLFPFWTESKTQGLPASCRGVLDQDNLCVTLGIRDTLNNALDYTSREPWQILQKTAPIQGIVSLNQIHSAKIHQIGLPPMPFLNLGEGDGLSTTSPGVVLTVRTADCLPLWIHDSSRMTVLHVGYRGLALGIVEKGLALHCPKPRAVIGLHLRSCCLEIRDDVLNLFTEHQKILPAHLISRENKIYLSLAGMVREILNQHGVEDIVEDTTCTSCDQWYSYRKNKTAYRIGHAGCLQWPQIFQS